MFPFEEAVKYVAKIFALKMIHYHVDDKIEYENMQHLIVDKLSRIENAIDTIKIKNLKVSLEFFKMAIMSIKIKGFICEIASDYLKSAHNLSIHGYETVSSISDKLMAIKITIASSILLYNNDATFLNINISTCLEKILNNVAIQKTVSAECRNDFTFRPDYRKNFVSELKDFVDNMMAHLSANVVIDKIEHKSLADAQLLAPTFALSAISNLTTNFLFWNEINVVDKANPVKCLSIRGNIIRIGTDSCTKMYEYTGNELNFSHETCGTWYLEELGDEYTMAHLDQECVVVRNSDGKKVHWPLFTGRVPLVFRLKCDAIGAIHSLANKTFLHTHQLGMKTIVNIDFDAKENEQVVETRLSYDGYYIISSGCVLNDGTLVVTAYHDKHPQIEMRLHRGSLMLLKKNIDYDFNKLNFEFIKINKKTFDEFAMSVKTLDSGHLFVLTERSAFVVYPKNNPHNCLSGDEHEEWAVKNITSIDRISYFDKKKKVKIIGDNILLGCNDHFIIIRRSAVNPIEYDVQKIYGTKSPIIDIDVFNDNTICTLDETGLIMTWSQTYKSLKVRP